MNAIVYLMCLDVLMAQRLTLLEWSKTSATTNCTTGLLYGEKIVLHGKADVNGLQLDRWEPFFNLQIVSNSTTANVNNTLCKISVEPCQSEVGDCVCHSRAESILFLRVNIPMNPLLSDTPVRLHWSSKTTNEKQLESNVVQLPQGHDDVDISLVANRNDVPTKPLCRFIVESMTLVNFTFCATNLVPPYKVGVKRGFREQPPRILDDRTCISWEYRFDQNITNYNAMYYDGCKRHAVLNCKVGPDYFESVNVTLNEEKNLISKQPSCSFDLVEGGIMNVMMCVSTLAPPYQLTVSLDSSGRDFSALTSSCIRISHQARGDFFRSNALFTYKDAADRSNTFTCAANLVHMHCPLGRTSGGCSTLVAMLDLNKLLCSVCCLFTSLSLVISWNSICKV